MEKKYILMVRENSKYEDFYKYHFKLFENYRELQKHLLKFWNEPYYTVFEETNIRKDKDFKFTNKRRYYE